MKSHDESHAEMLRKREENKKQFQDFMFSCLRNKEIAATEREQSDFQIKII